MDPNKISNKNPAAEDLPLVFYARAETCGIWLAQGMDGNYGHTRNFAKAASFATDDAAHEAWEAMTKKAAKEPKAGAWTGKGAVLFEGVEPGSEPAGLSVYLAMCQGRFVGQKEGYNNSVSWVLTSNPCDAHVFMSVSMAMAALARTAPSMPNGEKPEMAVLPLRGGFGPPLPMVDALVDRMAASMAAKSAREAISEGLPEAEPAKARKPRGL